MKFSVSLVCLATIALAAQTKNRSVKERVTAKHFKNQYSPTNTYEFVFEDGKKVIPTVPDDCLFLEAYNLKSDNEECNAAWGAWQDYCYSWAPEIMDTYPTVCSPIERKYHAAKVEKLRAPAPEEECMTTEAYLNAMQDPNPNLSVPCNKAWSDWLAFCDMAWNDECTDVEVAIAEQFRGVDEPTEECFNEAAYEMSSDSAVCNAAWAGWNLFCSIDMSNECDAVEEAFEDKMAQDLEAPQPDLVCYTADAYNNVSENQACNKAWIAWEKYCYYEGGATCFNVKTQIQDIVYPDEEEEEQMNLAKSAEERGSSQNNYGVVVGAAAILGAVYAMRK